MNLRLLKEVISWWQYREFLEIYNVVEANKAFYFTVEIDGDEYDVSIKDASLREPK